MKKVFVVLLSLMLTILSLASCSNSSGKQADGGKTDGKGLSIVTTIFPEYDWAREILGDKAESAELTLLQDNGTDLHSYQPSAEDIMKITTCDVFVYVGGESDDWVDEIVENSIGPGTRVVNLMDVLGDGAKEEEVVEGMQEDHDADEDHDTDADHDHDADEDHDTDADHDEGYDADADHDEDYDEDHDRDDEEPEYDEHVWLSLRNAKSIVNAMAEAFADADTENGGVYKDNAAAYIEKLDALDGEYSDTVKKAKEKTLLFGDRFPFRYLTDDYGLKYYAAFVGCSAETEASFKTVTFLADKVDELGLTHVMIIDGSDAKIADTIIKNTRNKDQEILTLDSMQTIAMKEIEGGKTYLGIMEENLEVLKKALEINN